MGGGGDVKCQGRRWRVKCWRMQTQTVTRPHCAFDFVFCSPGCLQLVESQLVGVTTCPNLFLHPTVQTQEARDLATRGRTRLSHSSTDLLPRLRDNLPACSPPRLSLDVTAAETDQLRRSLSRRRDAFPRRSRSDSEPASIPGEARPGASLLSLARSASDAGATRLPMPKRLHPTLSVSEDSSKRHVLLAPAARLSLSIQDDDDDNEESSSVWVGPRDTAVQETAEEEKEEKAKEKEEEEAVTINTVVAATAEAAGGQEATAAAGATKTTTALSTTVTLPQLTTKVASSSLAAGNSPASRQTLTQRVSDTSSTRTRSPLGSESDGALIVRAVNRSRSPSPGRSGMVPHADTSAPPSPRRLEGAHSLAEAAAALRARPAETTQLQEEAQPQGGERGEQAQAQAQGDTKAGRAKHHGNDMTTAAAGAAALLARTMHDEEELLVTGRRLSLEKSKQRYSRIGGLEASEDS